MTVENSVKIGTKERVRVQLDEDSVNKRARQIPAVLNMIRNLKEEAKSSAIKWKKEIKEREYILNLLQEIVETGVEPRDVECERVFDIQNGITWAEYKGEKYNERAIEKKELDLMRQGNMFEEFDKEFQLADLEPKPESDELPKEIAPDSETDSSESDSDDSYDDSDSVEDSLEVEAEKDLTKAF